MMNPRRQKWTSAVRGVVVGLGAVVAIGCGASDRDATPSTASHPPAAAGPHPTGAAPAEAFAIRIPALEEAKVNRARLEMMTLDRAYKTYYVKDAEWPTSPEQVHPLFENGAEAFVDPWGGRYRVEIVESKQPDGTTVERPRITCTPPGRTPFSYPEK